MSAAPTWTDDRVHTLTRLWREGLSASQIARALAGGVTRNAVIGKVHRLGLSGRTKPSAPALRARREARPRRVIRCAATIRRPTPSPPLEPPPEIGAASILSVRRGQCRWPSGDPLADGFCLCGAPTVRGAYCAGHAEIAYRPLTKKPPRDHLLKLAGLA
ncbi:GcrA family cell cycle regulator [Phenylobacterium sp.]|uniref:GcrA family cell cycle regulator n=1 Tax=Phenylobacterium sp. TaxID=1871053 RepID=UPI00391CF7C3